MISNREMGPTDIGVAMHQLLNQLLNQLLKPSYRPIRDKETARNNSSKTHRWRELERDSVVSLGLLRF